MCLKCAPAVGPAALRRVPAAGSRSIPGRWKLAVLRQEAAVYSPDVLQNLEWFGLEGTDHPVPTQQLSNLLKRYCLAPFLALFLRDC